MSGAKVVTETATADAGAAHKLRSGPIVVIWHRFGPYHLARLAACARIFEVVGIEMSGSDLTYAWKSENGPVPYPRHTLYPDVDCNTVDNRLVADRITSQLDELRPAAVAIPSWGSPYSLAALAWCLRTATPAVVMVDSNPEDKPRFGLREWLKRRIVSCFGAGLACKPDYLMALGMPSAAIKLGYNVVDNAYFEAGSREARQTGPEARKRHGLARPFFLTVARFVPKKNLSSLIAAYAVYCNGSPSTALDLVILGSGPLKDALQAQVSALGLTGAVHFPGFSQYDTLPEWYGMAQALILPSTVEQWGLVVNEAMATGLPVLISDRCGCASSLVEPAGNGWTFPPHDVGVMAARMQDVAQLPDGGKIFGQRSKEIIAAWSPDRFARELLSATQLAATQRNGPRWLERVLLSLLIPRVRDTE
jgi:1,2-diacylglycerol 3-alpha-glucosyltransferase